MKQRYQMLLSFPLWIPVFVVTMLTLLIFEPKTFVESGKEFFDIIKWAWRN